MLHVYINYPNCHISIHRSSTCGNIRQQNKKNQRIVEINHGTFSKEVLKFLEKQHRFGSEADFNDMWLRLDFDDTEFELHVVDHLRRLLAHHYSPFDRIKPKVHCQ